ncbi:MAG: GTP-binding protein [Bacteroidales bacterium]|nr:GTP-binding protein [Bacteroidales bacterium]
MSKIPVYLITGFLGSGKTTFLEHALDFFNGKGKIGIVQNEFAPANIDGKELKRTVNADFNLLEINNGSVFCVCLLSGFIKSLISFIEQYHPDVILLECSGLSDVLSVAQVFDAPTLQNLVYLSGTICIIDAVNFEKTITLMPRVKHQIMLADYLLINKADMVEDTGKILQAAKKINPFGKIYTTVYCNAPPDEIFQPVKQPSWEKLPGFMASANSVRPEIQSAVFRSVKPLKSIHLEQFICAVISKTYRVKGIIWLDNNKHISLQSVFEESKYAEVVTDDRQTELIAVGKEVDAGSLKRLYHFYNQS